MDSCVLGVFNGCCNVPETRLSAEKAVRQWSRCLDEHIEEVQECKKSLQTLDVVDKHVDNCKNPNGENDYRPHEPCFIPAALKEPVAPPHVSVAEEFTVQLRKTCDLPRVGLDVDHKDEMTLEVTKVKEGLVKEYNNEISNPELQILPGDRIISVNGVMNDNKAMVQVVMKEPSLTFVIRRYN